MPMTDFAGPKPAHALLAPFAAALFCLASAHPALAADEADAPKGATVTVLKAAKSCFDAVAEVSGTVIARDETMVRPERQGLKVAEILADGTHDAHLVESNYFQAFRLLRFGITLKQISDILHYFVAELYPHTLFRQRAKERLQHQLPTVSAFVAREIRCQTLQLVTRNKGAIGADDDVVQVVADRQLLAQCRIVEFPFVLFKS